MPTARLRQCLECAIDQIAEHEEPEAYREASGVEGAEVVVIRLMFHDSTLAIREHVSKYPCDGILTAPAHALIVALRLVASKPFAVAMAKAT